MNHADYLIALGKATTIEMQAACAFAAARELTEMLRDRSPALQSLKAKLAEIKTHPGLRGSTAMRENIGAQIADAERDIAEHSSVIAAIRAELTRQQEMASTYAHQRDATAEVIKRMRKEFDALRTREPRPMETNTLPGGLKQ